MRQHPIRFGQPALGPELLVAAFARQRGELGPDGRIGGILRVLKQRRIQRLPGAIEFHQAVRRNTWFLRQRRCGVDQQRGLCACFAFGHLGFPALLGFAVHPPVVVAEFALRQFQRFLAAHSLHRGMLDIDEWR